MIGSVTKTLLESGAERGARIYNRARRPVHAFVLAVIAVLFAAETALAQPQKIIAFGDSLTAGYLLPAEAAFPAQLEKRLRADGFDASVVNAGVSGETTAGGLARADYALEAGADLVILELGANDMLRGLDPSIAAANLEKLVRAAQARQARVLLAGMVASGNFGADYKTRFDSLYPELATRLSLPLYSFFLEGVSGVAGMTLPDGLHPSPAGVVRIVAGIAPLVEKTLKDASANGGAAPVR